MKASNKKELINEILLNNNLYKNNIIKQELVVLDNYYLLKLDIISEKLFTADNEVTKYYLVTKSNLLIIDENEF
jgi:hypothetical protein